MFCDAGLLQENKQLPDRMLQLMPLLESHGKVFADKSLISISGSCLASTLKEAGLLYCHDLFVP